MNKILMNGLIAIAAVFSTSPAFARGNSARATLNSLRPANYLTKGHCDIRIDCAHYKMSINGEDVGQIICARSTGANFSHKTVRLATSLTRASGRIMPRGFPMLATTPSLCGDCFIHAYPWVGPKSHSLGCVGITVRAWDKLVRCGGSEIAFRAMNGAVSNEPGLTQTAEAELESLPAEAVNLAN